MEKADNAALNKPNQSDTNINTKETMLLLYVNDIKMECEYDDCEPDKVYIPQTITGENDIKQEPCDTNDSVETNIVHLPEIVNCGDSIKQEEEFIPSNTEACFVDDKVIVQETVFLSHVKKESNEDNGNLCCGKCNEEYNLYCTRCPMLTRILDNHVPNVIENRSKNTLPEGILDIRQTFLEVGVFALKVIPEDVIFGPFEGLDSVPSTAGSTWKLKGGKLVYPENSERLNWMHYVKYVPQSSDQNLLVFQYQDRLYYRSTRKIHDGEELLVYYCEEQANNLEDGVSETYLHPIVAKEFKDVFACTYCCVGYGLEEDLLKHQLIDCSKICAKTPVEGIVQCSLCKIYMDKREHSEYHMKHCWERNSRKSVPSSVQIQSTSSKIVIITNSNSDEETKEKFQCAHCSFESKYRSSLIKHLLTHSNIKKYECSRCHFKTNSKRSYVIHDYTQHGLEKFICEECKEELTSKQAYELHMRHKHLFANGKVHTCEKCDFKTNRYDSINAHRKLHERKKKLKCRKCPFETDDRYVLREHFNQHEDVVWYQCPKCCYKSNKRHLLKQHLYIHEDEKPFKCEKCDKQFTKRRNLVVHVREKHVIFGDEY